MVKEKKSEVLVGSLHQDERGTLRYNNNFDLTEVRRFHIISNASTEIFRAWQGHKKEQKWFIVLQGSFSIKVVRPDNWEDPSEDLPVEEFILTKEKQVILRLSGGFATGFKALEPNSELGVFSDMTLEESLNDDYRFDKNKWVKRS